MTAHSDKTREMFRKGHAEVQRATLDGTGTTYFSLKPGFHTTIMINKAASTGTLKMTNGYTVTAGVPGLVDAEEFGENQSESTDDYHKGHTAGFTGCEIDISAYVADIEVVITQFHLGD